MNKENQFCPHGYLKIFGGCPKCGPLDSIIKFLSLKSVKIGSPIAYPDVFETVSCNLNEFIKQLLGKDVKESKKILDTLYTEICKIKTCIWGGIGEPERREIINQLGELKPKLDEILKVKDEREGKAAHICKIILELEINELEKEKKRCNRKIKRKRKKLKKRTNVNNSKKIDNLKIKKHELNEKNNRLQYDRNQYHKIFISKEKIPIKDKPSTCKHERKTVDDFRNSRGDLISSISRCDRCDSTERESTK